MKERRGSCLRMALTGILSIILLWAGAAWAGTTLSGVVLSSEEFAPMAGVGVLLQSEDEIFTTLTADDGVYIFSDVPAGQYTVSIDEAGIMPVQLTVALNEAEPLVLNLVAEPEIDLAAPSLAGQRGFGTAVQRVVNVKGKWAGRWKSSSDGSTGALKMSVVQQGANISGKITATNTPCNTVTMPYTGTLSGSNAQLQGSATCQGVSIVLNIAGKITGTPAKRKITGQWTLYLGPIRYDNGTYTLNKK